VLESEGFESEDFESEDFESEDFESELLALPFSDSSELFGSFGSPPDLPP
jgi:hypothetical protein